MAVYLSRISMHPDRIAITKGDPDDVEGLFFLDFARPLLVRRWLGFGPAVSLRVPVIHQGEFAGDRAVDVSRSDPAFATLRSAWKAQHPKTVLATSHSGSPATVAADFRRHFPGEG